MLGSQSQAKKEGVTHVLVGSCLGSLRGRYKGSIKILEGFRVGGVIGAFLFRGV